MIMTTMESGKILTDASKDILGFFNILEESNAVPQIFIISDTHFGHNNIIKYCNRPYENAEQMNEDIIKRWNETVGPNDIVIHCGDFCLGKGGRNRVADSAKFYREKLNGKIILILGNHDDKRCAYVGDCGFDAAFFHYHIFGESLMCCHSLEYPPLSAFDNIRFSFYGHVHNNDQDPFNIMQKRCNVCVEEIDYKPLNITPFLTAREYYDILNVVKGK